MMGYIVYDGDGKRPLTGFRQVNGVPFSTWELGRREHPCRPFPLRQVRHSLARWKERGIRSAVFPVDFPYTQLFVREGVHPVDTMPLRRELAVPAVMKRLEKLELRPTQTVVAVAAEQVDQAVEKTVTALAKSYRYVMLAARRGGEALAGRLRRDYGIALMLQPPPEQMERADALLLFCPREDLTRNNPVVYALYPGDEKFSVPLLLPKTAADAVEANCDREQLASALYRMGVLPLKTFFAEIPC